MTDLLILFAVAMAVSAVGWKYFVYFFSLGYGYGIAALAITMGVLYHANLTVPTIAMLVLLFIFGVRLGTYLLVRERKAVGYRKILYGEGHSDKKPAGVMIMIWLFCALLYVAQVSPVAFRLANGPHGLRHIAGEHQRRAEECRQEKEPEAVCGYRSVPYRPLPELSGRSDHLDGRVAQRDRRRAELVAVADSRNRVRRHRVCDVQRRPPAGTASERRLRQ